MTHSLALGPTRRRIALAAPIALALCLSVVNATSSWAAVTTGGPTDGVLASDTFDRLVTGGWGDSGAAGPWTVQGATTAYSIDGSAAVMRQTVRGTSLGASTTTGAALEVQASVAVSFDKSQTGGGTYASLVLRQITVSDDYRVRLRFLSDRTAVAQVMRRSGGSELLLAAVPVSGLSVTPGIKVMLAGQVTGQSPTRISVKAWAMGAAEPSAWSATAVDTTLGLQVAGTVGLQAYLSSSSTSAPQNVRFDDLVATTPATSLVSGPADGAALDTSAATFGFTSTRSGSNYACSTDGGPWSACSSPQALTALPDGTHTFSVRATDLNAVTTPVVSRTWSSDTRAPLTSLTSGTPAAVLAPGTVTGLTSASFAFITDEAGIFACSLDYGTWTPCAAGVSYSGLVDGKHSFGVRATDAVGNQGPAVGTSWTVDTVAPAVTLSSTPPASTTGLDVSVAFSSNDSSATSTCRLDGSAWSACTSPASWSGLATGTHTVAVRSTDVAGNVSNTASTTWEVTTPPPPAPVAPVVIPARPGPTNTGVPAGTRLTPYYGNLVITTPGATYDALDIHGFVTIKAPNVKITRSIIRGGVATGNVGLITSYDTTATGFVLEDSELAPEFPSVWLDGIKGGNFTIRRVNSWGTTDNVKVHGNNVTVDSSWLHGTVYRLVDPNQGGGPTHNDAVQILGGKNLRILNSTLEEGHNSAIQVTQDTAPTTDLVVSHNWIDGGGCSVNLSNKGLPTMSGITVDDNLFGRHQLFTGCAAIVTRATTLSQWNNTYEDNGTAIRLTDGG